MNPKIYYECLQCKKIYSKEQTCCSTMQQMIRISSVFFHPTSLTIDGHQMQIQLTGRDILKHFAYGDKHLMDYDILKMTEVPSPRLYLRE